MSHFYFDIWDGDSLVVDEEGLDLPGQWAAEIEAALSLVDMAKDLETFASIDGLAIQVRDGTGLILRAKIVCEKVHPIN